MDWEARGENYSEEKKIIWKKKIGKTADTVLICNELITMYTAIVFYIEICWSRKHTIQKISCFQKMHSLWIQRKHYLCFKNFYSKNFCFYRFNFFLQKRIFYNKEWLFLQRNAFSLTTHVSFSSYLFFPHRTCAFQYLQIFKLFVSKEGKV